MSRILLVWLLAAMIATPAKADDNAAAGATFVTLGTGGGPALRAKRSGPANAVVVGRDVYLFDVGPGTLRQLAAAGLANYRLRAVFLSHHHIDHIGDLSPLFGTRWVLKQQAGLPVYGPPGTANLIAKTLAALSVLQTVPVTIGPPTDQPPINGSAVGRDLPYAADPLLVYSDGNIRVSAIDVAHFHLPNVRPEAQPRSLAYRIEAGGRTFTFSGDTGPTDRLARLASGSDVLVCEVVDLARTRTMLTRILQGDDRLIEATMAHMEQDHLAPEEVARIAHAAGVKQIVLTHLVPGLDDETDLTGYSGGVARTFGGRVVVASDLDRF